MLYCTFNINIHSKFMLHCSYIRSESRATYNGMIIVLIFILYEVLIFMHFISSLYLLQQAINIFFCYEYGNSYFIPDIRVHTCTATVLWFDVILWHNLPSASAYVFFCAHKGHITEFFFSKHRKVTCHCLFLFLFWQLIIFSFCSTKPN